MGAGLIIAILVVTLIGIISTPSNINTGALLERKQAREISAVVNGAIIQRQNYTLEFGQPLPTATWRESLNTQGAFLPELQELDWDYAVNGNGAHFCLSIEEPRRRAYFYSVFQETLTTATFNGFVASTCGATTSFSTTPDFTTTDVVLTIYAGR
jgi:hypothetical protein